MIEKIKIGEQEISVKENPELLKLVESVRKEEKDKLYGEITSLKATIAEAKAKSGKTEAEIKELEDAKAKLKELEESKKNADKELKELQDKVKEFEAGKQTPPKKEEDELKVDKILAAFEKTLESKLKTVEDRINEIGNVTKKVTVESKRKELLDKHKGYLIPELLTGNTVEELENNLQSALETSKKYITVKDDKGKMKTLAEMEEAKKKAEEQNKQPREPEKVIFVTNDGSGNYVPPMPPEQKKKPEEMIQGLGDMSLEDFKKNKDVLKKQLMEQMKQGD